MCTAIVILSQLCIFVYFTSSKCIVLLVLMCISKTIHLELVKYTQMSMEETETINSNLICLCVLFISDTYSVSN